MIIKGLRAGYPRHALQTILTMNLWDIMKVYYTNFKNKVWSLSSTFLIRNSVGIIVMHSFITRLIVVKQCDRKRFHSELQWMMTKSYSLLWTERWKIHSSNCSAYAGAQNRYKPVLCSKSIKFDKILISENYILIMI